MFSFKEGDIVVPLWGIREEEWWKSGVVSKSNIGGAFIWSSSREKIIVCTGVDKIYPTPLRLASMYEAKYILRGLSAARWPMPDSSYAWMVYRRILWPLFRKYL